MRILVLGATGFTGKALLQLLVQNPALDITALLHHTQAAQRFDSVTYVQASLHETPHLISIGNYDYVFHLARISGKKWGDIGRSYAGWQGKKANKRIVQAVHATTAKLIYLSGSLLYGHFPQTKATETTPLHPEGFAKYYRHAERPFEKAVAQHDPQIMLLRAPWILGNGSWFTQLYHHPIRRHNKIPVYGDKKRKMSLITVEDCAAMLWHYARHAAFGKVYNIYTHSEMPYSRFIRQLQEAYECAEEELISPTEIIRTMGKTVKNAVCCEVVLDTLYKELLHSYKPIHRELEPYIRQLAKNEKK